METIYTLIEGLLWFLLCFVAVYLIPFLLLLKDHYKEKKKELEEDINSQENWYKSVKR